LITPTLRTRSSSHTVPTHKVLEVASIKTLRALTALLPLSPRGYDFRGPRFVNGVMLRFPPFVNGRFVSRTRLKRRNYFRASGLRLSSATAFLPSRFRFVSSSTGRVALDGHVAFTSTKYASSLASSRLNRNLLRTRLRRLRRSAAPSLETRIYRLSSLESAHTSRGPLSGSPVLGASYQASVLTKLYLSDYLESRYMGVKKSLSAFVDL
jgi:hypothetical protein